MAPRWKTQPCVTSAGLVQRPSAMAKTPRFAAKRSGSDTLSAPWAGPIGARPIAGGARTWSARHRRNTAAFTNRSVPSPHTPHASSVWHKHSTITAKRGACTRWVRPCRRCGGAVHWGGHDGGRHGGPSPVRDPTSTDAVFGFDPFSVLLRGAAPAGFASPSRAHPGPTGARGRRLGLSFSRQGQPTPPTAARKTAKAHPGHPREGPGQAVPTRPTPRGTRPPGPRGPRRHRACAGGMHGGHGHGGTGHPVRLSWVILARMPQHRATWKGSHGHRERRRPGVVSPSTA
jgi:hypothetical protein